MSQYKCLGNSPLYIDDPNLLSFASICYIYAAKLKYAVSLARAAGKKYKQPEIAAAALMSPTQVQRIGLGLMLPTQEEANRLAIALCYPPLSRLPVQVEKKERILWRADYEMSCADQLVYYRNPKLITDIWEIAYCYERLQNQEQRKRYDLRLHYVPLRFIDDPETLRVLLGSLCGRVDFYQHDVPYLNIWELKDRPDKHKSAHQHLPRFYVEESAENIRECQMVHYRFMYDNQEVVENFLDQPPRLDSWGASQKAILF